MENKQKFPIVETKRLILRRPLQKDANALLEATQDEAVMKYYGMAPFGSKAEALGEINWFNKIFPRQKGFGGSLRRKVQEIILEILASTITQ